MAAEDDDEPAPRNKGGRPSWQPKPEHSMVVKALVSTGQTHAQIANYLDISRTTMRKHFKEELAKGGEFIRSAVEGKLVQKALQGDRGCMFFLLERRFGWVRPTFQHQMLGSDGKPIAFHNTPDDQLAQIIAALSASLVVGTSAFGGREATLPEDQADRNPVDTVPEQPAEPGAGSSGG